MCRLDAQPGFVAIEARNVSQLPAAQDQRHADQRQEIRRRQTFASRAAAAARRPGLLPVSVHAVGGVPSASNSCDFSLTSGLDADRSAHDSCHRTSIAAQCDWRPRQGSAATVALIQALAEVPCRTLAARDCACSVRPVTDARIAARWSISKAILYSEARGPDSPDRGPARMHCRRPREAITRFEPVVWIGPKRSSAGSRAKHPGPIMAMRPWPASRPH